MTDERKDRFRSDLLEWGDENVRSFPWRDPDTSFYEVFVAELFLTQTPADNVAAVYPTFLERFPDLAAIRESSTEELLDVIRPLGFQNQRAKTFEILAASYDEIPQKKTELKSVHGIGPYVANATRCFALGDPLPIVDRNVDRVYGRVFEVEYPDTKAARLTFADDLLPSDRAKEYNLALLDFGALICKPSPNCEECFAPAYCDYYRRAVAEDSSAE